MAYDDPPTPAHSARPIQGQRCAACGHVEPDAYARFCGVCGSTLGQGAPAAQGPHLQPEPAMRYGTVAPPMQSYGPGPAVQAGLAGHVERPEPILYTVPSVGFGGPARIGAAVAAAFTLLPCVLFGFIGAFLIHASRLKVESWQGATVKLPVTFVSVDLGLNFVDLMHLRPLLDKLVYWDDRLWLAFAVLWLAPWVVWIVAGAFFGVVLAATYNLVGKMGGGIQVTLTPKSGQGGGQPYPSAGWQVGPPQGPVGGWQGPPEHRR